MYDPNDERDVKAGECLDRIMEGDSTAIAELVELGFSAEQIQSGILTARAVRDLENIELKAS